jgi:hypothetical protein
MEHIIKSTEISIDEEFNNNRLHNINYAQSIWTLLSVLEDDYFKNIVSTPDSKINPYVDSMLNAISHPILFRYLSKNKSDKSKIVHQYIHQHYTWAYEWITKAKIYDQFCSVFPLWHKKKLQLYVDENHLITNEWRKKKFEYEVYNRIIQEPNKVDFSNINTDSLLTSIMDNVKVTESEFKINYNPKISKIIIDTFSKIVEDIYNLPEHWETTKFTYGKFKEVFIAIQALLFSRLIVRINLENSGMKNLGYSSAVWVVSYEELLSRIVRYTNVEEESVISIFDFLKYSSNNITTPDIALQPLFDLENGFFALSPFIWLSSNSERNFCVLLNRIATERQIYLKFANEKEAIFRDDIIRNVKELGYDAIHGNLDNTDLDIAIIDRSEKVCVCIELKWFISPAEIREVNEKSEELIIGIGQAKKLLKLYKNNDSRLANLIKIDNSYNLFFFVGSKNWIGFEEVQDVEIPIVNMRIFLEKLIENRNLKMTANWFSKRQFLPKEGIDYEIVPVNLELGKWRCNWYGISLK